MSGETEIGIDAVDHFVTCLGVHDWDGLATTIADDGFTRVGAFCEVVEGKEPSLALVHDMLTPLQAHEVRVERSSHKDRFSYVELSETFELDDVWHRVPQCLVFERNEHGLITSVSVFIKRPGENAPVKGGRAT
jgi:hypothetical protein